MPGPTTVPLPSPELAQWVRSVAADQDPRVTDSTPVVPLLTYGLPTRPIAPIHSQVYICAGVIVKIHGARTVRDHLARRVHCLAGPDIDRLWIQPLIFGPFEAPGHRLATIWPRVSVLGTIDTPPWPEVGVLLAKLHRLPIRDNPPRLGGHTRLERAVKYLQDEQPELAWLAAIGRILIEQLAEPSSVTFAHGDFHLGQLGHTPLRRSWKLMDIDNFGIGNPAWDLATPATFWAAGLLDDASWNVLLDSYRDAGGPAIPASGDPWLALNLPTQASALIAVTQHLINNADPAATAALVDVCRRLARD